MSDLTSQAKTLAKLATTAAQAGNIDRAALMTAKLLALGVSDISFMGILARFFPESIGKTWEILSPEFRN